MRNASFPGASITLRVDGSDLHEYPTDASEDDPKFMAAFVEAVPGANFSVELILGKAFPFKQDHLDFSVSLDGIQVRTAVVTLKDMKDGHSSTINGAIATGRNISTLERFAFAEHKMTDAKPKLSMRDKVAQLGEVTVQLTRSRILGNIPNTKDQNHSFKSVISSDIPEKALKGRAITCHAQLGPAEVVAPQRYVNVDYPYGKKPLATYTFKYRTRRDLQIEGIIERTPEPVPLEDRDPDTLTVDEARELVRRMRTREQDAFKIKSEFKREKRQRSECERSSVMASTNDESDGEGVSVVSEDGTRKRARNAETVDLTDD